MMKQRVITAFFLILVFVPILIYGGLAILIASLIVSFAGAFEMLNMFSLKKKYNLICKISVALMTSLVTLLAYMQYYEYFTIKESFGLITLVLAGYLIIFVFNKSISVNDLAKFAFTMLYVGLGTSILVILRHMGLKIILLLVLTTFITDTFAYFFGVSFGKHKIAPKISPKKSYEGSIGGTLMATLLVPIYIYYTPVISGFSGLSFWYLVLFVFVLSIVIQIGDLVASKIKREYGIKDFSNIFPGHGGVLDRFDSMLLGGLFMMGLILYFI